MTRPKLAAAGAMWILLNILAAWPVQDTASFLFVIALLTHLANAFLFFLFGWWGSVRQLRRLAASAACAVLISWLLTPVVGNVLWWTSNDFLPWNIAWRTALSPPPPTVWLSIAFFALLWPTGLWAGAANCKADMHPA